MQLAHNEPRVVSVCQVELLDESYNVYFTGATIHEEGTGAEELINRIFLAKKCVFARQRWKKEWHV